MDRLFLCAALLAALGCGHSAAPPPDIDFSAPFRFGVATAATQIEDHDTATDWYLWTEPTAQGGLGNGAAFVDDAVMGYDKAIGDVALLQALHVDSYRFSMEWARIEPKRGKIDEAALDHYSKLLDALRAAGIRPLVTVHHFSNPVWVDDPRDPDCKNGPSDANLCGLGHPQGGALVVQAMADHAKLLAERFGDRVDDWGTVNEPINYLLAAYGVKQFPPGKSYALGELLTKFVPVLRDYLSAHVAMYNAIKQYDTVDADGDGVAANVGMSLSTMQWVAAFANQPSSDPIDVGAQARMDRLMNHLFVDALVQGAFDPQLDGSMSEPQPSWRGKIDWLGIQYYGRIGVSGHSPIFPVVNATPCLPPLDFGSCLPPADPTYCVPIMNYEYFPPGQHDILVELGSRWPKLPLYVTEAGIATDVGERRAQNVVRTLEQIDLARQQGIDVRGYYHWSLLDNFEWALGFAPHFGLYHVDRASFARAPTLGADVFSQIAGAHRLGGDLRAQWGGDGPLAPEPNPPTSGLCK